MTTDSNSTSYTFVASQRISSACRGLCLSSDAPERHYRRWNQSGDVLADREDVAVGILEPSDSAAVGSGPDAEGLVLGEGIFFRSGAAVAKPAGDRLDVFDLPAEDGALQRREIGDFDDANHVAADAHDQGEFIEADELESELAFVKGAGFVVVLGGDEADHFS